MRTLHNQGEDRLSISNSETTVVKIVYHSIPTRKPTALLAFGETNTQKDASCPDQKYRKNGIPLKLVPENHQIVKNQEGVMSETGKAKPNPS